MNNEHAQSPLPNGRIIGEGKYKITRLIGSGAFGCTYEAEYIMMESKVAIKELFLEAYCNRDAQGSVAVGTQAQAPIVDKYEERFLAEARDVFKLQHPNIVRITDIIRENGTSYFVMDYVEGESLQQIIDREGPLPEERALRYVGQVMDALHHAHANNKLHLDVQPANILIDQNDNAVLIEFGEWKQPDKAEKEGGSTSIINNADGYTPVEQLSGAMLTPASDIYALGATLYTALTGTTPPPSHNLATGFAKLKPLPGNVSFATKRAVASMLQPKVKARPQTIDQARAGLPTQSVDDGPATLPYNTNAASNPGRRSLSPMPKAPNPTAPLSGTLPLSEIPDSKPAPSGTVPLSEIPDIKPERSGTMPLSEIPEAKPAIGGTMPLSEIPEAKKPFVGGTMPLSSMPQQPKGGKKKKSGTLMWVLIIVGAVVVLGGVGGWLAFTQMQAKEAKEAQQAAEKAVSDRYGELKYQCEKDIEYGDKISWKPLVSAGMLLDSLNYYLSEYSDFEYYPLDDSGLNKIKDNLGQKRTEAKNAWMRSANDQYHTAEDYSAAIERWHNAALLSPDADVKEIVRKFADEKHCQAAYMAVYKASASAGKLTITYYGLSNKPVNGVAINYDLDGKSGKAIVNIEPGFNTATVDINSTASRGQLALSCNGIVFYNQELDNR